MFPIKFDQPSALDFCLDQTNNEVWVKRQFYVLSRAKNAFPTENGYFKGGLAQIPDEETNNFIKSLMIGKQTMWIAPVRSESDPEVWKAGGKKITYTNWQKGEPN